MNLYDTFVLLNESPFIVMATSNVRPRFSLLQWTMFSIRYALRSKNQFSVEHVMQWVVCEV